MAGFQFDQSQGDGEHSGKVETYAVQNTHATLLAPGDVVVIQGTAVNGVQSVDAGVQASAITGVVAAFDPIFEGEQLSETGLPASQGGSCKVHIDPNLNFDADVINGPLTDAQVGQNADADFTAATKSGGLTISNMTLDAATAAVTGTLQFRIVQLLPNKDGVVDGLRARVRLNNTTTQFGAGGV